MNPSFFPTKVGSIYRNKPKKIVFIVFNLMLASSCIHEESMAQKSGMDSESGKITSSIKEVFDGLIISSNATKLHAPNGYFSIKGHVYSGNWIKLEELVGDGDEVKKGDVIGGFEFHPQRLFPKVMERIAQAEAELEEGKVGDAFARADMLADIDRSGLEAERLGLDISRGDTVSERELKRFVIQQELANFDVDASKQYLRAQKVSNSSTRRALGKALGSAREDRSRFDMFKKRFKVLAPHDGVVRFARHRRRKRKIKKGDGMPAGMHFASLAKDSAIEITILIPEPNFETAISRNEYVVRSPNGDERFPVDVISMDPFPQTIGFVKQDTKLPNALEIVYIVHGKFRGDIGGMKSGLEVKVELP